MIVKINGVQLDRSLPTTVEMKVGDVLQIDNGAAFSATFTIMRPGKHFIRVDGYPSLIDATNNEAET